MSKVEEKDAQQEGYVEPTRSGLTRSPFRATGGAEDPTPAPSPASASRSFPPQASIPRVPASPIRGSTAQLARFVSEPALDAAAGAILSAIGLERAKLALVVEPTYERLGAALERAAERLGHGVELHVADLDRLGNEAFVGRLAAALQAVDGAIYVGSPLGVAPPLRAALFRANTSRRDAILLGVDDRTSMHNLPALSRELETIAARLEAHCKKGKVVHVEGLGGTDLHVTTGAAMAWHHDIGRLEAPGLLVLPAGRSLFCPQGVSGTLAPDGGVLLPGEEVRAAATRLRLHFEHGRLVDAEGPLADRLLAAARAVPNGTRVGQVVFGTNPSVLTPVGHEGQDLTMPGLHVVLGDSRPEHTGAVFCAPAGITLGVRRPDVRIDGEPILVRGKFARSITA